MHTVKKKEEKQESRKVKRLGNNQDVPGRNSTRIRDKSERYIKVEVEIGGGESARKREKERE